MKFLGRIILILAIAIAGIYCLPYGPQKLEYLMFKFLPNSPSPSENVTVAPVEEEVLPDETPPVETIINVYSRPGLKIAIATKKVWEPRLTSILHMIMPEILSFQS